MLFCVTWCSGSPFCVTASLRISGCKAALGAACRNDSASEGNDKSAGGGKRPESLGGEINPGWAGLWREPKITMRLLSQTFPPLQEKTVMQRDVKSVTMEALCLDSDLVRRSLMPGLLTHGLSIK